MCGCLGAAEERHVLGLLCFCQIRVVLLDDPLALRLCFGVGFLMWFESDSWCDFGTKCIRVKVTQPAE